MILSPEKPLSNGRLVAVEFLDSRPGEQIFVKLLPPRFYPDLRRSLKDEARQAEIFTGRDADYIDSLRPESVETIVIAGWQINREHCDRNLSRTLEETANQALQIMDMLKSLPSEVQELVPEVVATYRQGVAFTIKNNLPDESSEQAADPTKKI